jgi:hypothetical protein
MIAPRCEGTTRAARHSRASSSPNEAAELLDPIHVDEDPERVNDRQYVESIYLEVESAILDAMDRLAKQRHFPIFG